MNCNLFINLYSQEQEFPNEHKKLEQRLFNRTYTLSLCNCRIRTITCGVGINWWGKIECGKFSLCRKFLRSNSVENSVENS